MSAQPIALFIPEEIPEPKRLQTHRQSWLQDLQPVNQAWKVGPRVEIRTAPTEGGLALQDLLQATSFHQYIDMSGTESSSVISEIDALLSRTEDEVVPTRYAYEKSRSLIEATYGEINRRRVKKPSGVPEIFPKPLVTTDDQGGIRVSWRSETKQVRANFGARPEPELRSYVYFESALEHAVEPLDTQHLAGRLAWLTGH